MAVSWRCAVVLVMLALPPGRIVADPWADAKELKDRGVEAFERGDYDAALDWFKRAYHTFPSPRLRYNLGLVLAKLGRYVEALDEMETFVADRSESAEYRAQALQQIKELEQHTGRIVLMSRPEGAQVVLDGVVVGVTPLARPLRVLPGVHEVTGHWASAPGSTGGTVRERVSIGSQEERRVELVAPIILPKPLQAHDQSVPALRSSTAEAPRRHRWWIATFVVTAAVALAAGVVTYAFATATDPIADAISACDSRPDCTVLGRRP